MTRLLLVAAAMFAASTAAAEPLVSDVYETPGDAAAITRRATTCLAKNVTSGLTTADTIVTSDPESGVVIARNAFILPGALGDSRARSEITVEAKPGRFRITHDKIERLLAGRWVDLPPRKMAKTMLEGATFRLVSCVQKGPVGDDF